MRGDPVLEVGELVLALLEHVGDEEDGELSVGQAFPFGVRRHCRQWPPARWHALAVSCASVCSVLTDASSPLRPNAYIGTLALESLMDCTGGLFTMH
jgi:hypothetical protein